ncbi:MAG: serine/threonine protein kinase [Blautia sp.]|nr:serine/threonine protein kinase [Blautia sp.]
MICIYCLQEKGSEDQCPYCGNKDSDYHVEKYHLPPRTILQNRFEIGRVLGEGGFSITYLCLDRTAGRPVAIKELYIHKVVTRENSLSVRLMDEKKYGNYFLGCRKMFIQEAETLRILQDKSGIVNIYGYFEQNNTVYLVMEYLDGMDLKTYLEKYEGSITYREAFETLRPVMRSLRELNRKGIIHRDIAPDNIHRLSNGKMKLMDFGSAKNLAMDDGQVILTVKEGYAPYEQYVRNYQVGAWMDVYAMAATYYRCITGVVPQRSPDRMQKDLVVWPREMGIPIPEELEEVLKKGMALSVQDRYKSMQEFYDAMKQAFGIKNILRDPPSPGGSKEKEVLEIRDMVKSINETRRDQHGFLVGLFAIFFIVLVVGLCALLMP